MVKDKLSLKVPNPTDHTFKNSLCYSYITVGICLLLHESQAEVKLRMSVNNKDILQYPTTTVIYNWFLFLSGSIAFVTVTYKHTTNWR